MRIQDIGPKEIESEVTISASRFLEYTDSETQMRYRNLDPDAVREIKSFPILFMQENYVDGAFVGTVCNIISSGRGYKVTFKRNLDIRVISPEDIKRLTLELGIQDFEFYRTHWAIKNCDLFRLLSENDISPVLVNALPENKPPTDDQKFNKEQIFIVHGHDEHAKNDVKSYVESKNLDPIILDLQASEGKTIIEKIDHYTNVGFGIVLYTECDIGAKSNTLNYKWRARQNVVFEHGYLIAKLSRS